MKRGFLGSSKKESAGLCTICKFTREESIDTLQATSIDRVNQKSIDSNTTPLIDIACEKAEKVEILIVERDDFDLEPIYIQLMLPEDHHFCKLFPYTLAGDATHWFKKLPPISLTTWNDTRDAFLNKFLYDTAANLEIEMESLRRYVVEDDEQHVSGELSRVEESGTEDATSTSTDSRTSTSTDDVKREVTMEDSLELEEWLEDMNQNSKKKLDDDQHISRVDLETSKASIDRHKPYEIDRQPPQIINLHSPDIDQHRQPIIDRHHQPNIDRCPLLDRPPIWTEEGDGFHKIVKRIHDHVKAVVPCAVVEVEFPVPPDRSMLFSSHIEVLDDYHHVEASQRGLGFRDEVDMGPAEATSIDTDQIPSNDINKLASINANPPTSIHSGRVS
ncbi:hypothetical protein F2Q70_00016778 [Brassica cretica]|uniref:Retrotransposon gag domain-containing protein n=1 Tax=Brassica cretica TaxID=69181 RepID=A0A3N6SHE6_BRACR|nr:hypothetical protein F2Q70_00016778 [Brassica cretica]KAF2597728.1 hypothetical protein F2Q68_00009748 [Brassica cretica]